MLERYKRPSLETVMVFHFAISILSIRQLCLVIEGPQNLIKEGLFDDSSFYASQLHFAKWLLSPIIYHPF